MGFRQFLLLQCAAFVLFGLALGIVPGPFLEGIYQVDAAGDTAWIRLFGATLLGIGAMEWQLLQNFDSLHDYAGAFIYVPAFLTVAFIVVLIAGTDVFNAFFNISSLVITGFLTAGHAYFAQKAAATSTALA